jgi:hypothetical protein
MSKVNKVYAGNGLLFYFRQLLLAYVPRIAYMLWSHNNFLEPLPNNSVYKRIFLYKR